MNLSFSTFKVGQLAGDLIGRVNLQMQQAGSLDDSPHDQAPGQPGEVLLDQPDSFVQLSYDPATGASKSYAFKANESLADEAGNVIVPKDTEASYSVSGAKQSFGLQVPTPQGTVKQEAVVDNDTGMILFSDGTASAQISVQDLQVSQAGAGLVQALRTQMMQTAQVDESPEDKAAGKFGQVLLDDEASNVQLSVSPAGALQSFSYTAKQSLVDGAGNVVVPAGMATAYSVEGPVETFRKDIPTEQGVLRQQVVLDNANQNVDYQEFILKA